MADKPPVYKDGTYYNPADGMDWVIKDGKKVSATKASSPLHTSAPNAVDNNITSVKGADFGATLPSAVGNAIAGIGSAPRSIHDTLDQTTEGTLEYLSPEMAAKWRGMEPLPGSLTWLMAKTPDYATQRHFLHEHGIPYHEPQFLESQIAEAAIQTGIPAALGPFRAGSLPLNATRGERMANALKGVSTNLTKGAVGGAAGEVVGEELKDVPDLAGLGSGVATYVGMGAPWGVRPSMASDKFTRMARRMDNVPWSQQDTNWTTPIGRRTRFGDAIRNARDPFLKKSPGTTPLDPTITSIINGPGLTNNQSGAGIGGPRYLQERAKLADLAQTERTGNNAELATGYDSLREGLDQQMRESVTGRNRGTPIRPNSRVLQPTYGQRTVAEHWDQARTAADRPPRNPGNLADPLGYAVTAGAMGLAYHYGMPGWVDAGILGHLLGEKLGARYGGATGRLVTGVPRRVIGATDPRMAARVLMGQPPVDEVDNMDPTPKGP